MNPIFTIIIPVVHSCEDLERCLTSLQHLDYSQEDFHVVLINCHVFQGLEAFLEMKLPTYTFQSTVLSLPKNAPSPLDWLIDVRVNEARNLAIRTIPGQYYVFTEDDCTYAPDWLHKFETALDREVGAIGGPDILPQGLGWFPRSLDCLLNSFLGTAGTRRGDGASSNQYYPRKENMVIPANVLERVGNFLETMPVGGEMEMAKRIRNAGFQIKFLPDNPVWHRRVTTFWKFVRLTAFLASEKVKLMRQQKNFRQSLHFLIFLTIIVMFFLIILAGVNTYARIILGGILLVYVLTVLLTALISGIQTRSIPVGLGVLLLIPFHHSGLIWGILSGAMTRRETST